MASSSSVNAWINDVVDWAWTGVLALMTGAAAWLTSQAARLRALERDTMTRAEIGDKLDGLEESISSDLDKMEVKITTQHAELRSEIASLARDHSTSASRVYDKFDALRAEIKGDVKVLIDAIHRER